MSDFGDAVHTTAQDLAAADPDKFFPVVLVWIERFAHLRLDRTADIAVDVAHGMQPVICDQRQQDFAHGIGSELDGQARDAGIGIGQPSAEAGADRSAERCRQGLSLGRGGEPVGEPFADPVAVRAAGACDPEKLSRAVGSEPGMPIKKQHMSGAGDMFFDNLAEAEVRTSRFSTAEKDTVRMIVLTAG